MQKTLAAPVRFYTVLSEYLAYARETIGAATFCGRNAAYEFWSDVLGDVAVFEISVKRAQEILEWERPDLNESSHQHYLLCLRVCLSWAARTGLIGQNPLHGWEMRDGPERELPYITTWIQRRAIQERRQPDTRPRVAKRKRGTAADEIKAYGRILPNRPSEREKFLKKRKRDRS